MQWTEDAREILDRHLAEIRHVHGANAEARIAEVQQHVREALARRGVLQVSGAIMLNIIHNLPQAEWTPPSTAPPPLPLGTVTSGPPPLPTAAGSASRQPVLAGHVARQAVQTSNSPQSKRGCFFGTMITGAAFAASAALFGFYVYYMVGQTWESERAACAENIGAIGEVIATHADPGSGHYPPLAEDQKSFLFGGAALDDLDISLLRCPGSWYDEDDEDEADILADADYIYLGYAVRDQQELEAFVAGYIAAEGDVEAFMARDSIPGPAGPLERLRADLPNPASIPLLIEWEYYHLPSGAHVLYLDGHVDYIEMDSKFPVTQAFYDEIQKGRGAQDLAACRRNLIALADALKVRADQDGGAYPSLAAQPDTLFFDGPVMDRIDLKWLYCPAVDYRDEGAEPDPAASDYYYLGYAVRNEDEMDAYVEAYMAREGDWEEFRTLPHIDAPGGNLPRLHAGLENLETIPLLIEQSGFHGDGGGHVLFMDGHIEYLAFDEAFPMTEGFFGAIGRALDYRNRIGCKTNIEALGAALAARSAQDGGDYPPLDTDHESYIFGGPALENLDKTLFRCPSAAYPDESEAEILDDADYYYLGFAVRDQADMEAYAAFLAEAAWEIGALNDVDSIPGPQGPIPRLRSDLPEPSTLPVLVEWGAHNDSGGHVLYLDGHVEYVEMESKFPMTEAFFDSLYEDWEEPSLWSVFWEEFWKEYNATSDR